MIIDDSNLEVIIDSCSDDEIIQYVSMLRKGGIRVSSAVLHEFLLYLAEDQDVLSDICRAEKLLKLIVAIHPELRS